VWAGAASIAYFAGMSSNRAPRTRAMEPTVYRPQGPLARFVEYFWTFECRDGEAGQALKMFATGVSGILVQHHDGRPALGSTLHGHPVRTGGCPTSFLKSPPMQFNDGSVELKEFSRENITDQLLDARSDAERVARLSEFLRVRVDGSGPEDLLVTESLRLIQHGIRSIRVPHLLKRLKVSERQFERRFVRAIGVSPHQYIRIVRFREAVRLMRANRFERLSDVAYDLHYVDQSHFIKDVRAFSGYAPTALIRTVQAGVDLPCAVILGKAGSQSATTASNAQDCGGRGTLSAATA
jgi:AraC-like DNA-binding protein